MHRAVQQVQGGRTVGVRPGARSALAAMLLCSLLLPGCSQTKGWLDSVRSTSPPSDEPVILGAPEAEKYLRELQDLSSGDPALQAEIFADSQAASQLTPNPSTNLRFALVLATPGHPETDPQQAQNMLRELLTQTELMTPTEISLASIYLNSTEELMVLSSEARRLRASSHRTQRTEEAAINQRLATVEADNRRLRRELEDAENKLEAITSIEQSIRDQDQ